MKKIKKLMISLICVQNNPLEIDGEFIKDIPKDKDDIAITILNLLQIKS